MRAVKVTSPSFDRGLLRVVCFAGAPVLAACSTLLVRHVAADAGEAVVGVLSAGAVSIALVVLGIVGSRPAAADEQRP